MKFFLSIALLLSIETVFSKGIPVLKFDEKITWKDVFDYGFRPKHLEGLERNTCVCADQEFWIEFKGRDSRFKVERGRASFSFKYDDFLTMVWHQGEQPISLAEGKRRAEEFSKVFDGYVVQEMTLPRIADPNGMADAGNDENNVKVRVGEYLIWYGFDNSLRTDGSVIPHFYIAWGFPGMPDLRVKDSGDVVRPPAGYEWYSLDPKVDTPDPGMVSLDSRQDVPDPSSTKPLSADPSDRQSVTGLSREGDRTRWWMWIGLLIAGLALVLGYLKRRLS